MATSRQRRVDGSRVIVVSRTLQTLNRTETTTSSQRYELGLATEIARDHPTIVIGLTAKESMESGDLSLVPLAGGGGRVRTELRLARYLSHQYRGGTRILAFGYEPGIMAALLIARLRGARVYTIIFDTHVGSLRYRRRAKAVLFNLYFRVGRWMLRYLDGLIVVTPRARAVLERHHPNVLLSRIPLQGTAGLRWSPPLTDRPFRIVYAGALEEYNAVRELVHAVESLNALLSRPEFELVIFGAGSCAEFVEEAAAEGLDVVYGGVATHAEVSEALRASHVGVNPRDTDHPVHEFAFPSKLIDLMGLGIPVLTSDVVGTKDLDQYVTVLGSTGAASIAAGIRHIADNYEAAITKAQMGIDFVEAEYKLHDVAFEIEEFLGISEPSRSGDGP